MGDRTTVVLTVLAGHQEEAIELIGTEPQEEYPHDGTGELVDLTYYEVNYGNLPNLYKLSETGIPFNSRWGNGCEYTEGETICRYDSEGEPKVIDLYDNEHNPPLQSLISLIDDPKALREFILEHVARITPIPWDNQLEYSNLHRAKKLIGVAQ